MTPLLCAAASARATSTMTEMNSASGIGGDCRRIAVSRDTPVSSSITRKSDAVLGLPDVDDLDDVRVVHPRRDLRLHEEAARGLGVSRDRRVA